ncbi:hypothetical protein ES703_119675 [subsurface metagenome]
MMGFLICGTSTMAVRLSYIDFAADDRLYARLLSCHVEIDSTIHCTMVGNGEAIHAQFLCPGNKLGNAAIFSLLSSYMEVLV